MDVTLVPQPHKMIIGFCPTHLCERGTTAAVFDYAYYNQTLLGNTSIIFYQKNHPINFPEYEVLFNKTFTCIAYTDYHEIDSHVKLLHIDRMYFIKSGQLASDPKLVTNCPNLIHCVFDTDEHGDRCAFISEWLSLKNNFRIPFVPHMINLADTTEDLRSELNIPKDAVVFGGFGGRDSFNISFVHHVIDIVFLQRTNVYFLFMNFDRNTKPHTRIIYLPPTINAVRKRQFINTCDAMVHARAMGESFGIAVGEFSSANKPVITFYHQSNDYDKEHVRILSSRGLYYTNQQDLYRILSTFSPQPFRDWNAYRDYTPAKVMAKFQEIFLS